MLQKGAARPSEKSVRQLRLEGGVWLAPVDGNRFRNSCREHRKQAYIRERAPVAAALEALSRRD
jgi:hypothetical protein